MTDPKPGGVMVLSAAAGAGHMAAADALVAAFQARQLAATHVEMLRYATPLFKRVYADLYVELVNRRPQVLGYIYRAMDHPWRYQKRRLALDRLNTRPLVRLLERRRPGVVICTHFLPAEIAMYLRHRGLLDTPVGIVITDFDAHAMWLYRDVNWYFVAREETRVHLAALGIPPETVHVTGIPINPRFAVPIDKNEARLRMGLDPCRTTVLVAAGGFGMGPVESLVRAVHEVRHPVQIVVICGKNGGLERKLGAMSDLPHPMRVVGYTTEMDVWMAASDLLVGKAGGMTVSEAFARGVIPVIVNPIPGNEERNCDYFLEQGAAIRCNNLLTLAFKIDGLLCDRERFSRMRQSVSRIARPHAASDIVAIVANSPPISDVTEPAQLTDNIFEGPRHRPLIATRGDVDLIVEACLAAQTDRALLYAENLPAAFFDLSSGEAGAILQKLRNYGIRLALVCTPGSVPFSTHFPEMVHEESRRPWFRMFDDRETARAWLGTDTAGPAAVGIPDDKSRQASRS